MVVVGALTSGRGEDDTMLQCYVTNLRRLEELRAGHVENGCLEGMFERDKLRVYPLLLLGFI
jgi:hypothetical protein